MLNQNTCISRIMSLYMKLLEPNNILMFCGCKLIFDTPVHIISSSKILLSKSCYKSSVNDNFD